jgi:hypothetical protein
MTNTTNIVTTVTAQTKLLAIGRIWVNDQDNGRGTSPDMTLSIDNNLGFDLVVKPGSRFTIFKNDKKREGKRDADFRLAVSLPTEVADREIARQRALRQPAIEVTDSLPV